MLKGDRVRQIANGDRGRIVSIFETYNPITGEAHFLATMQGDDGRVWYASGCQLEIVGEVTIDGPQPL